MTEIFERLELCNAQIEESPYSHTVAAGWYAEDVPALVQRAYLAERHLAVAQQLIRALEAAALDIGADEPPARERTE